MGVLFLLFIVLPVAELVLLVRVGRVVGFGPTLGFVIAMGFVGAAAARSQGRRVFKQWQDAIAAGRVPEEGIVGGMLALLGAIFLIAPGLLTDLLGLILLIPFLRRPIARLVSGYLQKQLSLGRLRVYGMGGGMGGAAPTAPRNQTQVSRAGYRPSDVIDTQGEEVD